MTAYATTGIGSVPGDDVREAVRVLVGEVGVPYVPELPGRGPGADLVGRTAGLLCRVSSDFAVETTPDGWRFADAPGRAMRRASAWLGEDLDAVEDALQGYAGPLKVSACGPWTLAAAIELPSGERTVRDAGACRDLGEGLAEALRLHVAEVRARVPGAEVIVQIDEPSLGSVLNGGVPTASGLSHYRPIDPQVARTVLDVGADIIHCCAVGPPLPLLRTVAGVSIDLLVHDQSRDSAVGELLDTGRMLWLGAVPALPVAVRSAAVLGEQAARRVQALLHRLGCDPQDVGGQILLTPACGMSGASPQWVRTAYSALAVAGRLLRDETPELEVQE